MREADGVGRPGGDSSGAAPKETSSIHTIYGSSASSSAPAQVRYRKTMGEGGSKQGQRRVVVEFEIGNCDG